MDSNDSNLMDLANVTEIHTLPSAKRYSPPDMCCAKTISRPGMASYRKQGGERLGGETSGSERKGVMQWTGSELKSETQ